MGPQRKAGIAQHCCGTHGGPSSTRSTARPRLAGFHSAGGHTMPGGRLFASCRTHQIQCDRSRSTNAESTNSVAYEDAWVSYMSGASRLCDLSCLSVGGVGGVVAFLP